MGASWHLVWPKKLKKMAKITLFLCQNSWGNYFFTKPSGTFFCHNAMQMNNILCGFRSGHFLEISLFAVFSCFGRFLAVFGPLWACLGQGGKFIIHQMGWGLFLMVGSDSGTHFVIFGGCLRPQNTFLASASQMAQNGVLKPFWGPHGGKQFLQETRCCA